MLTVEPRTRTILKSWILLLICIFIAFHFHLENWIGKKQKTGSFIHSFIYFPSSSLRFLCVPFSGVWELRTENWGLSFWDFDDCFVLIGQFVGFLNGPVESWKMKAGVRFKVEVGVGGWLQFCTFPILVDCWFLVVEAEVKQEEIFRS